MCARAFRLPACTESLFFQRMSFVTGGRRRTQGCEVSHRDHEGQQRRQDHRDRELLATEEVLLPIIAGPVPLSLNQMDAPRGRTVEHGNPPTLEWHRSYGQAYDGQAVASEQRGGRA